MGHSLYGILTAPLPHVHKPKALVVSETYHLQHLYEQTEWMTGGKYTKGVSCKASVTAKFMGLFSTSVQHAGSNPTPFSPNVLKFESGKIGSATGELLQCLFAITAESSLVDLCLY